MPTILQTPRLFLREFTIDNTGFIVRLLNSPGWLKFIGDRNVKTEEQAQDYLLNGPIKSYRENGFGLSLVGTKDNDTPVGMCGLVKRSNLDHPDIGFASLPEFMGQGYAHEIAQAMLTYAREVLHIKQVLGITVPDNQASINLLQKVGLKFDKSFAFSDDDKELLLFRS